MSEASRVLQRDSVMARLVASRPKPRLGFRDPFEALISAVASQQLSVKAASTIVGRFEERVGYDAQKLIRTRIATLRKLGFSEAKSHTLKRLGRAKRDGLFDDLSDLDDDQVSERLGSIKGIGPWTVDMIMIFSLGRSDVWPTGDGGIQRAAFELYGVEPGPDLESLGDRFVPWRSHAAWYLWQHLDATPA